LKCWAGFHLFQRVVGFQRGVPFAATGEGIAEFPSLSESSGFPTLMGSKFSEPPLGTCFHLFQRVVGFRLYGRQLTDSGLNKRFPSLSESSGFPTLPFYDCLLKRVSEAKNDSLTKLVLV